MGFSYHINNTEVKKWVNNSAKRSVAAKQMMTLVKRDTIDKTRFVAEKVRSTGTLRNSINGIATKEKVQIWGMGYSEIALETGRGPGGRPPTQAIQKWVEQKLGITAMVTESGLTDSYLLASKIANKIAARGTRKFIMGGPQYLTLVMNYLDKVFIPKHLVKMLKEYTE